MSAQAAEPHEYGEVASRADVRPKLHVSRFLLGLAVSTAAFFLAALILPGFDLSDGWVALAAAIIVGLINAVVAPVIAAIRLPYTIATTFLLILLFDALALLAADALTDGIYIRGVGTALIAALVISAISIVLEVVLGTNDDDAYTIRVIQRIARRSGERVSTDAPGIVYLEIDGLARPVLQRAMRDGNAPAMARWLSEDTHRFLEWEPDLSSQTGASQAGILLGSNEDIPAFRWVEKERGIMMTCSAPPDCAEIERRRAGNGLLSDGGSSRGNLLSGEADHVILTVSRMDAEKGANPGYRAFFANGHNVTRALVLFFWEIILEWTAALRAIRRDVHPRGHRGGIYPVLRGAMCVIVRDLKIFSRTDGEENEGGIHPRPEQWGNASIVRAKRAMETPATTMVT